MNINEDYRVVKKLSAGKSIMIFFLAIISLVAEFVLYMIFGLGAAFSGSSGSIQVLAFIFGGLFVFSAIIGVMAIICTLFSQFSNGEHISYKIMYYTIIVSLIMVFVVPTSIYLSSRSGVKNRLNQSDRTITETDTTALNLKNYVNNIIVSQVKVSKTWSGNYGVFGEVKNNGNRSLDKVEIRVYALDKEGKSIYDTSSYPVLVSEFSFTGEGPLKPNYSRKFSVDMDEAPSEWSRSVKIVVSEIEFSKE